MKKFLRSLGSTIPLLLILLVGSWPYWASLRYWPATSDMPTWIASGAMSRPGWADWVFQSDHFSWYRPLTALSFSITHALSGLDPLVYRLIDLAFHLGAGCLCLALLRWMLPNLSRRVQLLALLVFLAHPAGQEVAPFLARRSFSMALFFGLGGLAILARELRTVPAAGVPGSLYFPATVVGLLFVAALYSSEGALVLIGAAPLVALQVGSERKLAPRSWLLPAVIPTALLGAALAWRQHVLGGLRGASVAGDPGAGAGALELAGDSLFALLGLPSLSDRLGQVGEVLGFVMLAAAAVLFVRALVLSLARWSRPEERMIFGLAVWTLATLAVFVATDTWAPRHTYLALAPFVLLLAAVLAPADGRRGSRRSPASRLPGLGAAMIVTLLLAASPLLHGREHADRWAMRHLVTDNLIGGLNLVERPVLVLTALPDLTPGGLFAGPGDVGRSVPQSISQPLGWANLVLSPRGIELIDFLYYRLDTDPVPIALARLEGRATFTVAEGQDYVLRTGQSVEYRGPDSERSLDLLPVPLAPERGVYALLCETETCNLQLVRVPIRPDQRPVDESDAPDDAGETASD